MAAKLRDGDYIADGLGGVVRTEGTEALLQRVLFRLTARRGTFPFWETLGSQLWKLDAKAPIRFSHENPDVQELYHAYLKKPLGEKSHHLLHTDHDAWDALPDKA